jgi:hypothetical protein
MKKLDRKQTSPAVIDPQALAATAGGDFDLDWCGTPYPGFPFPRGPVFDRPILVDLPVIIVRP